MMTTLDTHHEAAIDLLTPTEQFNLDRCEEVISRGVKTFIKVGEALAEIRDRRLYRATHATFADYCIDRWGFTRQRAHQLTKAAEVAADLSTVVDVSGIAERTLRPIAGLETAEERRVAWDIAEQVADTEPVTAKHTQYAAGLIVGQRSDPHKSDPKLPPAPACDSCGAPSTNKRNIGGLLAYRCDACTITATEQEHADQVEAARPVSPELIALCEQAEALGAQINYLALNDGAIVRVVPPPGYQQTPLDCDAADLRMLVGKWTHHAAPKAKLGRKGRAWWECAEQLQAVEVAIQSGDQLMAVRGAARLTIALAGDATRLALVQAPKAAELLEQEGHASIAALLRLLIAEEG